MALPEIMSNCSPRGEATAVSLLPLTQKMDCGQKNIALIRKGNTKGLAQTSTAFPPG